MGVPPADRTLPKMSTCWPYAMTPADRHVTALRKKAKKGFRGYPVATIAYYGADDRRATKVAVGIVLSDSGDVAHLERWFSSTSDVRTDTQINGAILQFIERHGARSVGMYDRIIGCPMKRGLTTPRGKTCPQRPGAAQPRIGAPGAGLHRRDLSDRGARQGPPAR
jgi:hypothetical protein